jgi:1,4-alpha-glucan branching enzyme
MYAYSENFILPLSHDEVVHGKRSLVNKMPGDWWQRRANLRLLLTYMWTQPGKKLLFMGGDFAQTTEWNVGSALPWHLLELEDHRGIQRLVRDLNRLYCEEVALFRHDFEPQGFQWIDCHDHAQSTLSYLRHGDGQTLAVVLNFTPVPRNGYRIGLPHAGDWIELLNSDGAGYGGSDLGNNGRVRADPIPWMGYPCSAEVVLPPLAGLILKPA